MKQFFLERIISQKLLKLRKFELFQIVAQTKTYSKLLFSRKIEYF